MLLKKLPLIILPFAHLMELQVLCLDEVDVLNLFVARLKLSKVSRLLWHCPSMASRSELCCSCLVTGVRGVAPIADHFDGEIIASVRGLLHSVRLLLLTLIWRDTVELISRFPLVSLAPALPATPLQGVLVLVPCKVRDMAQLLLEVFQLACLEAISGSTDVRLVLAVALAEV